MLGAVDTQYVYRIVDALIAGDGPALLAEAEGMSARSLAFASALEELAALFHRIAIAQAVPAAVPAMEDAERIAGFAERLAPEQVQLAYQICVTGRSDLALAPDEATGFSMTLLRLLAFEPGAAARPAPAAGGGGSRQSAPPRAVPVMSAATAAPVVKADAAPPTAKADAASATALPSAPGDWPAFVAGLKLTGMAAQMAAQTELRAIDGNALTLALPASHKHLADRQYSDKLKRALEEATGRRLLLAFEVGNAGEASLAAQDKRERAEQKAKAEAAFRSEPFVQDVLRRFDATIKPDSIKPVS
jgi:DNA polymerase-3 subunit gamma/tau